MHHATARLAIVRILAGSGFAGNAIALVLACRLHDAAGCSDELRRTILERCLAGRPDEAPPYAHPLNQQPVPDDAPALANQLLPALIAHPADQALNTSALWCLVQLWPHCGADERPLLRTRLLNSIAGQREDEASFITAFQLRDWQKRVPTHYGTLTPSMASLRGLLDAGEPLAAYLIFAEHLGMEVDLRTLCSVLGSLALQLQHERHDLRGELASLLLGTAACEQLAPMVPSEAMVTVLSQLAHRLWWIGRHGRLRPIRVSLDQSLRPFRQAVATGDITLAQRAARAKAGQQPAQFMPEAWAAVAEWMPEDQTVLLRLLSVLDSVRQRAGGEAIAIDDVSSIAALLAEMAWWRNRQHS